jgi:hypothetical protein
MKKHLPLAGAVLLAFVSMCFAQTPTPSPEASPKPKPAMTKAQISKHVIAAEKKLWEGWKNKDGKPFKAELAGDSVLIGPDGTATKAEAIKIIMEPNCDVKSYELSDFKVTTINSGAVLLTYKGAITGTCMSKPIPSVWASTVWVSRGGKWMAFSHQESNIGTN